jgi:hypothetical protein
VTPRPDHNRFPVIAQKGNQTSKPIDNIQAIDIIRTIVNGITEEEIEKLKVEAYGWEREFFF